MKKLETGNIETGTTSTLATIGRLLAAVVLLVSGGCQSMKENGIFSPRSGELFQTTKMGTGMRACSSWMRRETIARLSDTILEKTTKASILQLNAKTITHPRAVYSSSAKCLA